MHRVTHVDIRDGYCLDLTFADGTRGPVDLSDLVGRGVFAVWNDRTAFANVCIGEGGELLWGDALDLCPDSLYLRVTGKRPKGICRLLPIEPLS
ncbi:MAG: DUF2442 domain-containing protein [Planctomycetes bacterium]|jgi:hypothetical protein|nr:DUF2442 domain-containing protein [Phycisphaerae bacterium]NBB94690.1 DUF2442 domain-containing protein [Planctomycetota bacterium]